MLKILFVFSEADFIGLFLGAMRSVFYVTASQSRRILVLSPCLQNIVFSVERWPKNILLRSVFSELHSVFIERCLFKQGRDSFMCLHKCITLTVGFSCIRCVSLRYWFCLARRLVRSLSPSMRPSLFFHFLTMFIMKSSTIQLSSIYLYYDRKVVIRCKAFHIDINSHRLVDVGFSAEAMRAEYLSNWYSPAISPCPSCTYLLIYIVPCLSMFMSYFTDLFSRGAVIKVQQIGNRLRLSVYIGGWYVR